MSFWFVFGYFAAVNAVTFFLFWQDKQRACARVSQRRISERRLLHLTAIGGSMGAVAGQQIFRHKTQKYPFVKKFRLIVKLHILCAALFLTWDRVMWL